jgi:hypothetical protein
MDMTVIKPMAFIGATWIFRGENTFYNFDGSGAAHADNTNPPGTGRSRYGSDCFFNS